MALDSKFKANAEIIAFKAFFKTMKRYRLFFPILVELCNFMLAKNDEKVNKLVEGLIPIQLIHKKLNFAELLERLTPRIEDNIRNMGRNNTQYDYLVHCVNTMIQVFIEFGLLHHEERKTVKIPKLDILGEEIFNLAATKLFGHDFEKQPHESVPMSKEELKMAQMCFMETIKNGGSPQDALAKIDQMLKKHHNGETHYINFNSIDTDDSFEEESDEWDNIWNFEDYA